MEGYTTASEGREGRRRSAGFAYDFRKEGHGTKVEERLVDFYDFGQ